MLRRRVESQPTTTPPIYHSTNLPIYHSTNLPIYHSTNLPIYQSTNPPIYPLPIIPSSAPWLRPALAGRAAGGS
ncbi:MAG: hypothetical protein V9H69_25870 [Anaerolineae bacterium]